MKNDRIGEVARAEEPKRLREVACMARPQNHSRLYWWFWNHREELRRTEVEGGGLLPWDQVCGDLSAAGIGMSDGRSVTASMAKATWQRVLNEKADACASDAVLKS